MNGLLRGTCPLTAALLLVGGSAFAQPAGSEGPREALVLEGVIITRNPASSIALVRREGSKRARPIRVGQEFAGYVLLEVTRDSASLANDAGRVRLSLSGHPSSNEMTLPEEAPSWIHRDFSKATTAARFEREIPVILGETGLTERVSNGEIRGLTLTRLPDGTLLSESGLKLGDTILSINGEPLRGLDSLWSLLARFEDADELRVIVERQGEVVRFAYALTN